MAPPSLVNDVREAVDTFMATLSKIAQDHRRSQEYVRLLGGMGSFKKAKQRSTTPFGAFCAKKLEEANVDKQKGYRMTLQEFLDSYQNDESLRREYRECDKPELVKEYQAKKVKESASVPMRVSNISVSREVYLRLGRITASCQELNQIFGTEISLIYGRGNGSHTYNPGAFMTQGAEKWLQHAEIGHNCPLAAARQLDAFVLSGCAERVSKTKEGGVGPAQSKYRKTRANCRQMIQDGLASILKKKRGSRTGVKMNYINYEGKIVETHGVALDGWPFPGRICNPGGLSTYDGDTLMTALTRGVCKWIILTPEEVSARWIDNQSRTANGEQVYGPPRKQRARNGVVTHGGNNEDDGDDDDDDDE